MFDSNNNEEKPVFPAATVVLVRDGGQGLEVLMLRRSKAVKFGGGQWVFPGGRIDAEDYAAGSDDVEQAAINAALRETREEADLEVSRESLLHFSHWTAPKETPKRFATWFFLAEVEGEQAVTVDGGEIDEYRWCTPADALQDLKRGEMQMMPPTFVTLFELSHCASVAEACRMYSREVLRYVPKLTEVEGGICMLYPGDAGYDTGDNSLAGGRHRFLMLADGWVYQRDEPSLG